MTDKLEKVLVLMSVYNGQLFLEEQLKSIFEQKDVQVSVMIRDDGSCDYSKDVIDRWTDKLDIDYRYEENVGATKSFMSLIQKAPLGYDYYAFADQDDYWCEDKLKIAIEKLKNEKNKPALYYSDVKRVGSNLEEVYDPYKKRYHTEELKSILVVSLAPGCTMVFNEALLGILQQYSPNVCRMHDAWALQVCATVGGKIIYDPVPHILYRQHSNNVVGGQEKMKYNKKDLLLYRIHKFFDFSDSPYLTAIELKKGFGELISEEKKALIDLIISGRKSKLAKMKLIFTNRVSTPYFIYNLKFKMSVIMDKF